jgi:hypothetical protein
LRGIAIEVYSNPATESLEDERDEGLGRLPELPPLVPPKLNEIESARLEGYWMGVAATQPFLDQLHSDLDRLHRALDRGSFTAPMRTQGRTFFELEKIRNAGKK